ncbi:MAG: hypothetical protein J3Q66DRAFT_415768 [Benniella sp.]|nr:MAG: hypothetical protein J3Q66DRAFT_415768 [Benniella sp.]
MVQIDILDDPTWDHKLPPLPATNPVFDNRLNQAYASLRNSTFKENTHHALKALLEFGLTAEVATEKEAANSSVALAHYIAASLLNYSTQKNTQPMHAFSIRLTPTETILIPSHSKLLLEHLSRKLHINIYLFSSRAQPILFFSHQDSCSIAFLHRADSYHSVSEFIVLAPSSHIMTADTPMTQTESTDAPSFNTTPARFRETERSNKRRFEGIERQSKDTARIHLRESWYVKTKSYREEFDLGSEFDATHFRNILGSKESLEIWKAVVKDHFEEYWSAAASRETKKKAKDKDKEKGKDKDEGGEEEDNETQKDEGLRTCSATLKQILRSDIQAHYHRIVDILEDNQASLSTCVDELSALTQKSTLAVASGRLYHDADTTTTQPREGPKLGIWDRLTEILKETTDTETLPQCPDGVSRTMLELTRQFTTAVSNLWEGPLYAKLQDHLLSVLLRIRLAPIRKQRNMDKRKKFAKSTDGTQAQTTDTTQTADTTQITDSTQSATQSITATLVTQAAMPTQAAQIRMSRSEIKWKTKELCDELSDVWRKGAETEKQASRVRGILKQLLKLKNRTPDPSPRNNQDSSLHPMGLEDDQDDGEPENDEDQGNIANKDQKRKDAKGTMTNPTDSATSKGSSTAKSSSTAKEPSVAKESSAANLRGLQSPPPITETIDEEWVRRSESAGSNFSSKERNVVAHLANILRPYTPRRRDPLPGTTGTRAPITHVTTRAHFAMIANAVLRATGYSHFCQSLSPEVSAGSLQAVPLGAVGLYEMFCGQEEDRFDIDDADGNPLTSAATVTSNSQNREAVIGSFFDLEWIKAICDAHGISFNNRLVYVDQFTVRMVGKRLRPTQKGGSKKGRPNPWKEQLPALGMTKSQIKAKAEEVSATKTELENNVKSLQEIASTSQQQQTKASGEVAKNIPGAYDRLRIAREQVRSDRKALIPQEEELRDARKELYKWNGLLRAATMTTGTSTETSISTSTSTKTPAKTPTKTSTKTTPSWSHRTVEDKVSQLDISNIIGECGLDRQVAFAGTDYGLHYGIEGPESDLPKTNRSFRITAPQLNDITHTNKIARKRKQRMTKDVRDAMKSLSETPRSTAMTQSEVEEAQAVHRDVRTVLVPFENSKQRTKDLHNQRLRTQRAWTKVGSAERRFVTDWAQLSSQPAPALVTPATAPMDLTDHPDITEPLEPLKFDEHPELRWPQTLLNLSVSFL